jgi:hydrogenase-4 membrane subunit HyfE
MPRRSKKDTLKAKLELENLDNIVDEQPVVIEPTEELIFENNQVDEPIIEESVQQLELVEDSRVSIFKKLRFSFGSSLNVLLLILITYFVLTALINYKSILTGYERIFVNDFKDLFYWLRFTLGATAIVYFCFFVVGIDLKKEIQDDNKSAVYFALGLIAVTYFFGQRLFS